MEIDNKKFFKRNINRLCIYFYGYGYIPVADAKDDNSSLWD